ncbi:hypothetical protein IFT92_06595 [Peribacillus simplex]|nr:MULTISPECIES: hypothetical protein [Bacillaceae]MCP1096781.1 hypothetical protein [Bacillaceae bacterium OS4b]MBD8587477.1 hypothetical protein [Peribacillus simplex]MCF7624675.1 hypothetical protein [Peribacillus frigoritolerans]MEA3574884.1 hypothetical protein [Peribacillus frigoritolerans]NCT36481.1 hypothetical protein [Peribacillus frigoritolerans]
MDGRKLLHSPKYWLVETVQTLALMWLGRQSAEGERISEITWNVFLVL